MQLDELNLKLQALPGAMPVWHATVDARQWLAACQSVQQGGGYLVALWGSDERERGGGFAVHAALGGQQGLLCFTLPLEGNRPEYPDVSGIFPVANRMQRATRDLLGIVAATPADHLPTPQELYAEAVLGVGGGEKADDRNWLRHGAWPQNQYPLRKDFDANAAFPNEQDDYPFVPVTGDGVHEIAVGPVHAGTIEPGHFRFSIVGEKVLRLEERLGYTHKGIDKRFESMTLAEGVKLAGRVSGDSTVAYAWAYSMAAESATQVTPPARALWLRALFVERERVMNHLGDLGFLGNDAALAFGLAQFSRLKEDMLRTNQALFGHRYLMDAIIPGGVTRDLDAQGAMRMRDEADVLQREIHVVKGIYDEHAGLQDRFITTGRVAPNLAARLGLTGLAGRASGQAWDLRSEFPCAPYGQLDVAMVTHRNGDVAARVTVRFEEAIESLRLIRLLLDQMPSGEIRAPLPDAPQGALGIGWVEGWRGQVLVAIHTGENNSIYRAHAHDPSWQNWPLVEHAVIGNIVPDFPLINKSFNLSYSGQDL